MEVDAPGESSLLLDDEVLLDTLEEDEALDDEAPAEALEESSSSLLLDDEVLLDALEEDALDDEELLDEELLDEELLDEESSSLPLTSSAGSSSPLRLRTGIGTLVAAMRGSEGFEVVWFLPQASPMPGTFAGRAGGWQVILGDIPRT